MKPGLTTAEAWEYARTHLCHLCHEDAEDTCEGCGQRVCMECSAPDPEQPIQFCRDCLPAGDGSE